jgi:hypothetical protein
MALKRLCSKQTEGKNSLHTTIISYSTREWDTRILKGLNVTELNTYLMIISPQHFKT